MSDFFQASYFVSEIIAASGIALNTFQIISTFRQSNKKKPFDLSIVSLSAADLLSSVFTLIFMIHWHLAHNFLIKKASVIESVSRACLQFSVISSIFHLVFIAIERVFAVVSPMKFRTRFTTTHCYEAIAVVWILSLTCSLINFFATPSDVIGFVVLASEVLLVVTYSIICRSVKKHNNATQRLHTSAHQRSSAFRGTFFYAVYMTVAFILCTLPSALYATRIVKRMDASYVHEWARWMFYLNPTVDSLLYFYFKKGKSPAFYRSTRTRSTARFQRESVIPLRKHENYQMHTL